MDWHHPDYLPRRDWEKEQRPEADADFQSLHRIHEGTIERINNQLWSTRYFVV